MADETTRPNILFILADDLGWGDVGVHGSRIATPNIDRLARTGIELTQHYVCPVCTPTRVSLMTGRHPGRFGAHATVPSNNPVLPDGYRTLARMLRDAGYQTGLFGKWHLGSDPAFAPNNYGFDYSYGSLAGGVDPYTHRYKRGPHSHTWHRNGERIDEPGHVTDLITGEATRWIAERDRGRPWFCYVPFTAVHTPIKPPEEWLDRYERTTFDADPDRDEGFKRYAAYTSHMDYCVGRLIETLKVSDQYHNTMVVFASDNGAIPAEARDVFLYPGWQQETLVMGSNRPFRGRKAQLYEGGIRTPAFVRWHGVLPADRRLNAPLHMVDWLPTLAGLADASPDGELDGTDIWPILSGRTVTTEERTLYWNLRHNRFAVRRGDWKLISRETEEGTQNELYNIACDPGETLDMADAHPRQVNDMLDMIADQHSRDDAAVRPDMQPGD